MTFRNQCAFFAQQAVQQGRFSDIRSTRDSDRNALLDGVAQGERVAQAVDFRSDLLHRMAQGPAVGKFDILLREVEFQFEQGSQVQQTVAERLESRGVAAAHLVRGQGMCGPRRGGDQITDGLGLRQVEFPGQIGPHGKLSGSGHASAGSSQQPQDLRDDVGGAVAGNFHGIFARIGVRSPEDGGQHVVHDAWRFGFGGRRIHDRSVMNRVGGGLGQRRTAAEDAVAEREGLRTAHADDGDGTSRSGSWGDDGIVIGEHGRR